MTDAVVIRREKLGDLDAIRRVVAAAFKSPVEAELVDQIRASPDYMPELALVAEIEGKVVGHVMISGTLIRNESGGRQIAMLSPLAVDPTHGRQGIGSQLVRAAVALADERGEPLVVLEGNPAFYSRFGFEYAPPHGIEIHLPEWARPEAAQVVLLSAYNATDASLKGVVVYPPAFDVLN